MPLSRMENTTFAKPSIIDSHDMGLRTVFTVRSPKRKRLFNAYSVAFPQRADSTRLIEDETFNDSDTIKKLIDYEDGHEGPDSLTADKIYAGIQLSNKLGKHFLKIDTNSERIYPRSSRGRLIRVVITRTRVRNSDRVVSKIRRIEGLLHAKSVEALLHSKAWSEKPTDDALSHVSIQCLGEAGCPPSWHDRRMFVFSSQWKYTVERRLSESTGAGHHSDTRLFG
ncbi:uncharacterized protein TNCV_1908021 [Trichonephila clavipes]|nr:uncharacterized protein TNCV_1908021 [Trichonephila clavipes]